MGNLYDYITGFLACAGSDIYVGLKNGADEANGWAMDVKKLDGSVIGSAANKQEYLTMWNADSDNQLVGQLSGAYGPFMFLLHLKCNVSISTLTGIFVVPPQTIQSAAITFASGTTVLVPMIRIAQFVVGAAGAPMVAGDTDYTNSALINKRVFIVASGLGLPTDETGTGAGFDPGDRWARKTLASDTLSINNGVADEETIQVYAY